MRWGEYGGLKITGVGRECEPWGLRIGEMEDGNWR